MSTSNELFWITAFVLAYFVAPVSLVWGWARWTNRPRSWSYAWVTSFVAFLIASLSAILGIGTVVVGMSGAFEKHYDIFYRVVDFGIVLSLTGGLVAFGGIWRRNSLRWHALIAAAAMLGFWTVAFTWP